jgi:ABC-2 type transport system permease protein
MVIGFGWLFLLETIVAGSAPNPGRWLPGQLLSAVATDGTADLGVLTALLGALGYLIVASAAALTAFTRRDIR